MKHLKGLLVGAAGLVSAAFFALSGASCSQPAIQCVVAHGQFVSYFAKYELVSGDESCYGGILNAVGYPTLGEDIALSTYLQPTSDGKFADFGNRRFAIQSSVMGAIFLDHKGNGRTDDADFPYAIGAYTSNPDANNLCYAGGSGGTAALAAAEVNVPDFDTGEVDPMTMQPIILPAEHYRQEWKNLRVFVTAGVTGTQLVGEMHFEDVVAGCQADYKFVAVFPSVHCEIIVHADDDNDPSTPEDNDDADPDHDDPPADLLPDPGACNPNPDPDNGRPFGSGINPDFKVVCDEDLHFCVLDEPPLPGNP